jgi:hypothetical protein
VHTCALAIGSAPIDKTKTEDVDVPVHGGRQILDSDGEMVDAQGQLVGTCDNTLRHIKCHCFRRITGINHAMFLNYPGGTLPVEYI